MSKLLRLIVGLGGGFFGAFLGDLLGDFLTSVFADFGGCCSADFSISEEGDLPSP